MEGDLTTTYEYSFNRLTKAENTKERIDYTYDNNGNLTQKKITDLAASQVITWDYTFDYENRLVQVKKDSQLLATYAYDTH